MTLVNITRIIQRTALSIPRDFASRATQTNRAREERKAGRRRKAFRVTGVPSPRGGCLRQAQYWPDLPWAAL